MPSPPPKPGPDTEGDLKDELKHCQDENLKQLRDVEGKEALTLLVARSGSKPSLAQLKADPKKLGRLLRLRITVMPEKRRLRSTLGSLDSVALHSSVPAVAARSTGTNSSTSSTPGSGGWLPPFIAHCQSLLEVDLSGYNIDRIPKLLERLPQLKKLTLANNPLWRERPTWMRGLTNYPGDRQEAQPSNLRALRHLGLQGCGIDKVPNNFGSLCLTSLDLCGHCFSSLPESMSGLTCLKHLDLSQEEGFRREMTLPHWLGMLQLVDLNLTRLDVPPADQEHWGVMLNKSLEVLTASSYLLPVDGPGLRSLRCFQLCEAGRLAIPDSFNDLRALEMFEVTGSRIKVLPSIGALGPLPALRRVNLEECLADSSVLTEAFMLLIANVSHLNLQGNKLRGLPDCFRSFTRLEELLLSGNDLEELPGTFGQLSTLVDTRNVFRALRELPQGFGGLRSLRNLEIHGRGLSWQAPHLPDNFGQMEALESLTLRSLTTLSCLGEGFSQLGSLKTLVLEDLPELRELPSCLGSLRALRELQLSNAICRLPESIAGLDLLKLQVRSNPHLPELLESICSLESLRILDLGHNATEALPESIGNLTKLRHLGLDFCSRLRSLPDSIYRLEELEVLDLANTAITPDLLPPTLGMMNPSTSIILPGRPRQPAWLFLDMRRMTTERSSRKGLFESPPPLEALTPMLETPSETPSTPSTYVIERVSLNI